MISKNYDVARLNETWNKLGDKNRILFYEHLKNQCFNYGSQSDTPDSFLVMLADDVEYWKLKLQGKV